MHTSILRDLDSGSIMPGELRYGLLPITPHVSVPLSVMRGIDDGDTCFISGGLHGDEINGIRLVQMLMRSIDPLQLRGTIIFAPLLNPSGFQHRQRHVFEDNQDLNRSFYAVHKPRTEQASLSLRIAHTFFHDVIARCSFGIDCHDCGSSDALMPHPRVHTGSAGACSDGCTVAMGSLIGTKIILQRIGENGMMATEAFRQLKKPVLTVEVGGGMVLWPALLDKASAGIHNILVQKEFLSGTVEVPHEQFIIQDTDRYYYTARVDGLLYKRVTLGQVVHAGDLLATIHDPRTEQTEEIIAGHCGYVFSLKVSDTIVHDETILSLLQGTSCTMHGTKPSAGIVSFSQETRSTLVSARE